MSFVQSLRFALLVTRLVRVPRWRPARVERLQRKRLERLVRFAAKRSPLYREKYRGIDLRHFTLSQLPTTHKLEVASHFEESLTDRRIRRAARRAVDELLQQGDEPEEENPHRGKRRDFSRYPGKHGVDCGRSTVLAGHGLAELVRGQAEHTRQCKSQNEEPSRRHDRPHPPRRPGQDHEDHLRKRFVVLTLPARGSITTSGQTTSVVTT